jgi:ribosomal protein L11 methyltransferase
VRVHPALEVHATSLSSLAGDRVGLLLAVLDEHGPTAVEELADGLRVFFASATARDGALGALETFAGVSIASLEVPDEGWAERSQASLGAVTVGALTVAPPWAMTTDMRESGAGAIVIRPSMGFGTAHHASTRLCLRALQGLRLAGVSVLDVGTGSGVLAIAAHRLGASRVVACDLDPDALASAHDNLALNGIVDGIALIEADVSRQIALLGGGFDVIVANLTAALLGREAATFARLAGPDAHVIASGLQREDVSTVARAFAESGWALHERQDDDDWVGLLFVRAATSPTSSRAH